MRFAFLAVATAAGWLGTVDVRGEETQVGPLTAQRVVEFARDHAPDVLVASTNVLEARGRLAGAKAFAQENPVIEGVRGSQAGSTSTEIDLSLPIGFGLRRARRIGEARAGVEREERLAADAQRLAVGQALAAYYRVLHAQERLTIARDRKAVSLELRRIAMERSRTGDVSRLEIVVAETELSRAESEVLSEERAVTQERVDLATVLGMPSGNALEISGQLADRSVLDGAPVDRAPEQRADILAAEQGVRAADAAVSLARTAFVPDLSFRLNYEKTREDEIFRPGLALSLPIFDYGQGARGEANARRARAGIQLAALRSAALAEAEGARSAYQSTLASTREIEERALPMAIESEDLARRGYEVGKLNLPELLLVRANALDVRREHADRLLEAAMASIDLAVATGALP